MASSVRAPQGLELCHKNKSLNGIRLQAIPPFHCHTVTSPRLHSGIAQGGEEPNRALRHAKLGYGALNVIRTMSGNFSASEDGNLAPSLGNRKIWTWNGHRIAYQQSGTEGVPLVLVHGLGASSDHWQRFMATLGSEYTVYAIDLLGFGASSKPHPGPRGHLYNFNTWSQLLQTFLEQVVQQPATLVGNSAGGIVALQTATSTPHLVCGLLLLNCSMRHMHERNQPALLHPCIAAFQWLLHETPFGNWAYDMLAREPQLVANILQSAYGDPTCLSPQLLEAFQQQLLLPGVREVLLDVFSNSTGPLPLDYLPLLVQPTLVIWGAADPWEPVEAAEKLFRGWAAVKDFIILPGVGHFPQEEVPALLTSLLQGFLTNHVLEEAAAALDAAAAAERAPQQGLELQGGTGAAGGMSPEPQYSLVGIMAAAELDAKV